MYTFLIAVHVIACIVLILTILLQSGRGGGLSEAFGSSSTSTIFGTSASTFLQRATSTCAIIFLLTSLTLAVLSSRRSKSLMELEKIRQVLPPAQREAIPGELPIDIGEEEKVPVENEVPIEEAPIAE